MPVAYPYSSGTASVGLARAPSVDTAREDIAPHQQAARDGWKGEHSGKFVVTPVRAHTLASPNLDGGFGAGV